MNIEPGLDERYCRRPDWIGGRPLRLSDGQDWLMPPVDFSWVKPGMAPTGRWWGMEPWPNPGDDVMRLLWAIDRAYKADAQAAFKAQFDLARALLLKNYRLSDEDIRELLPFQPDRMAAAMENPAEASESMLAAQDVFKAFLAHIERALRNFTAEGIVYGHILYRIKMSDVKHLNPGA